MWSKILFVINFKPRILVHITTQLLRGVLLLLHGSGLTAGAVSSSRDPDESTEA